MSESTSKATSVATSTAISTAAMDSIPLLEPAPQPPPLRLKLLMAVFSGLLFYLISPREMAFLQWVAWVPLFVALQGNRPGRDFLIGWLGGAVLNMAGFYWIVTTITVFSNLPLPLALFTLGVFSAYGGLPYGVLGVALPRVRRALGRAAIFVVPAVWVTIEYLFPQIFPYYQGDVQYRFLAVTQVASLVGIVGVSYLVVASNMALFELWEALRGRARWPIPQAVGAGLLIAAAIVWGQNRVQQIDAAMASSPRVRVGLIQANYGVQELRRTPTDVVFARFRRLTEEAIARGATLVIWGEGASPYSPQHGWKKLLEYLKQFPNTDFIIGSEGRRVEAGANRHTNSVYAIHRDSSEIQRYDKNILLAFGEYLPGSNIFPSWKGKIKGIGDYVPGHGGGVFTFNQSQGQVKALMLICYEAILNGFVYKQAAEKPNMLVNITYDAWFGDTAAPHQFLMLVAARAVELGVPIVRVANTGISCVIDPHGRIRNETPLFQQAAPVEDVTLVPFPTLYQQIGDTFALLCGLTSLAAVVYYRRQRLTVSKGNDVA